MEFIYKATPKRVLILPEQEGTEQKTSSGLIIPQTAKKEPLAKGLIVSIDKTGEESPLEEGMMVIYPRGAGIEVDVNGNIHRLMRIDEPLLYGN